MKNFKERRFPLFVVVFLSVCLIAGLFFFLVSDTKAFTSTNEPNAKKISEIYNTSSGSFDNTNLTTLLQSLSGNSSANIGNVSSTFSSTLTSANIKNNNGGKNIIVTFGGLNWTPTHVTKDRNGNTIVTLWLSSSAATSTWSSGWYKDNPNESYPSNMYGRSYIRAVSLNAGGDYATSGTATSTASQNSSNPFAKFTMPSVSGSATKYLVKPADVAYQQSETSIGAANANQTYSLPNDAYGTPSTQNWYVDSSLGSYNYAGKTGYDAWKNDYIWLPSLAETGYTDTYNGIWDTDTEQRSNSAISWLRSGKHVTADYARNLAASGSSLSFRM